MDENLPRTSKCYHFHRKALKGILYSKAADFCSKRHGRKIVKPRSAEELKFIQEKILNPIRRETAIVTAAGIWIEQQILDDFKSMQRNIKLRGG